MLTFIGLGLHDERDITLKGRDEIATADKVYAEFYTSMLPAAPVEDLEDFHGVSIELLSRAEVEQEDSIVEEAKEKDVVFLSGGDAMVSTTHGDLRLRAIEEGVETKIIHGPSIQTAVSGVTGLQNYRFGKATTLPFPRDNWNPESPYNTILENLEDDLHTLVFLDIEASDPEGEKRYMTADQGAKILGDLDEDQKIDTVVGLARAGSNEPEVYAGSIEDVAEHDFGSPLHVLTVPGSLHHIEERLLEEIANL